MIKGSINMYTPNVGAPKCIREILMDIRGEINSIIVRVGHFKTSLTSMGRSSRQKINK